MILGLTGKAGSGKTTVCSHLMENDARVVKINFKDCLVEEMKKNFPILLDWICRDREHYEVDGEPWTVDRLFQEKPPLMRALMQEYGTEVRRGDDTDYWVKQWKLKAIGAIADGKSVVVDDCRFLNEAEAIRELGGHIIKIQRTDITNTGTHQSEVEMEQIKVDGVVTVEMGEQQKLCEIVDGWIETFETHGD